MLKKLQKIIVFVFIMVFGLSLLGCTSKKTYISQKLTLEHNYIYTRYKQDLVECQISLLFHRDNKGEYDYYSEYQHSSSVEHYKIIFRYETIANTVVCFYDSISYLSDHHMVEGSAVDSSWTGTFGYSENILLRIDGLIFVNENYLPQIPNFNKQDNVQ